jgi:hypothetical protein
LRIEAPKLTWVLAALLVSVISGLARSDTKPVIKSVSPLGVRAGRTTAVLIYGDNLAPKSIKLDKSTCTAKLIDVKPTDDKTKSRGTTVVSIAFTAPAGAPLANIGITLEQADKTLVAASVAVVEDADDEVQIKKPASTYASAMPISSKSIAIAGTLDGDTADVFKFEAKSGETWDIALLSGRGGSQLDPVLRLRDDHHITLMLSAGDKKKDRRLSFSAPSDSTYYIDITDAEARGGAGYDYRLTVHKRS